MDFVASRADEKKTGWRNRVGEFLRHLEATVFDPWLKPAVRGLALNLLKRDPTQKAGIKQTKDRLLGSLLLAFTTGWGLSVQELFAEKSPAPRVGRS